MTTEKTEVKVLPFKPKPKKTAIPEPRQITLQEFIDETNQSLMKLENFTHLLVNIINHNTQELKRQTEELKSKMRIVWVGFCIGWGLLVGAILSTIFNNLK